MFGLGLIAELQWDRRDIVCVLRLGRNHLNVNSFQSGAVVPTCSW